MSEFLNQLSNMPQPFEIGLQPIARDRRWLMPPIGLANYLQEKTALINQVRHTVFADTGSTDAVQAEVLELIVRHLLENFTQIYKFDNDRIFVKTDNHHFAINANEKPQLLTASRLVADDLVLMQKSPEGWRLAAGSVCFPSAWKLREKIGKVMADVHAPVPNFAEGSRPAALIERIFDNLAVGDTVERGNWSIHSVEKLHLPEHKSLGVSDMAALFIRGEVQTLTKLSSGTDILFTIKISLDPMNDLTKNPIAARQLADQLSTLDDEQLAYKGLSALRKSLHQHLIGIAQV